MPPSRRTTVAMQRDWTDGVPASPRPMPFPRAGEGNLEPPLSARERGGGEGWRGITPATDVVGKFLMTFKDFPASQTAGSFNLSKMQKQIEELGKGSK